MSIEIIKSKIEWDDFLRNIDEYDFYHTYDYHQISKSSGDIAILIKYSKDDVLIGLPFIIRKINGTPYYDATSPYGYSGPIINKIPIYFDNINFEKSLLSFFLKEKIISVFVRLNPYLPFQNFLLHGIGELSYLGKIVNINLTLSLERQRQKYHRRLKTHVNKANRILTMKIAQTDNDFEEFKSLYYENMKRVKAKNFYFFSDEYFHNIITSNDFKTDVLLAFHNETGKAIAACMFIKTRTIVQYHLSGASEKFLHLNGTKFLIDEMRLKANREGYEKLNLGGGLGANEDDMLFRFKSSFSDEFHPFFIWKLIVDKSAYKEVCKKNKIANYSSNFFPLYRIEEHI